MSIEQNLERIANALELLAQKQESPPAETAAAKTTRSKKTTTTAKATNEPEQVEQQTSTTTETQQPVDDWGEDFTPEDTPNTAQAEPYPDARAKAVELGNKSFSDVKENFYELLNAIRDSFGEKNIDTGKAKAREVGYAILDAQIGSRTLTESTLPANKFLDFTYAVEVARAKFFAK